jgi:hypothetical protein
MSEEPTIEKYILEVHPGDNPIRNVAIVDMELSDKSKKRVGKVEINPNTIPLRRNAIRQLADEKKVNFSYKNHELAARAAAAVAERRKREQEEKQ